MVNFSVLRRSAYFDIRTLHGYGHFIFLRKHFITWPKTYFQKCRGRDIYRLNTVSSVSRKELQKSYGFSFLGLKKTNDNV